MRILLWRVREPWTTTFVRGTHDYLIPVDDQSDGARPPALQSNAIEVPAERLRSEAIDVVVLQRPHEVHLAAKLTGRVPGVDVPAVYVEHNTPPPGDQRHPLADQDRIPIVHVTHFNELYWENGRARSTVIEHGIVDPGHRYTGECPRAAMVMVDPVRRRRALGTDLLAHFADTGPLDVFGTNVSALAEEFPDLGLRTFEGLDRAAMHAELARRRVYLHTARWTSLALSLLEAMHLGMPVVALAATEVPRAVPREAGVVSTDLDRLREALRTFLHDPARAQEVGRRARKAAIERYGLARFLRDWDRLLEESVNSLG